MPAGDVSCWMDEENLYWQANTEKGIALTKALSMLEDGGEEAVKAQQEKLHAILEKLPLSKLDLSKFGAGKTEALFNRPEWKSLSESCLGCGTCTFVCPTCQCYDVQEFNTGKTVRRFRAGTAVCTPTLPKCRPVNRDPRSSSASGSVLCTSWSISRTITTGSLAASAADGVCRSVRFT